MTFENLFTHPAVQALGHALLHFLWQGPLLALLLWMIKTIAPTSAQVRYAAASLIILAMPIALMLTMARDLRQEPTVASTAPIVSTHAQTTTETSREALLAASPTSAASAGTTGWAVCLWIIGVLLLSLRSAGGWMRVQQLKRRVSPADAELEEMMTRLKQRLSISAPVRLYTSAIVQVPTVIGWLRPYVLLPVTTITGLSESQLRAVLAHELAHIRRHDYLVNLLQTAVETVLFYHPAVWWVGKQMRIEREHCCDDIAVAVCGDPVEYAEALAELEHIRGGVPEPALAATGGELLGRIRRLLGQQPSADHAAQSQGLIAAAAVAIFIVSIPAVRTLHAAPQQLQNPATPLLEGPLDPRPASQNLERNRAGDALSTDLDSVVNGVNRDVAAIQNLLQAQAGPLTPAAPHAERSQQGAKTTELLIKLYDSEKDIEMKLSILEYLGASAEPKAAEKLLSIYHSDSNLEMRMSAVEHVAREAKSFETLVSLFDSESNIELKLAILSYIAGSTDLRAEDKLLSIVQSGATVEVRRAALAYIAGR